MFPPIEVDDYVPTHEEGIEDALLDARLTLIERELVAQLKAAKVRGDIDGACAVLSDATRYTDPDASPRYTPEEVRAWFDRAREAEAFFLGIGSAYEDGKCRDDRSVIRGLLRSQLVPTMPLREDVAEFMRRTSTPITDLARDASEHVERLTGVSGTWRTRAGEDEYRYDESFALDIGMESRSNGQKGTNTLKSFIDVEKASAIAYAIHTSPIEIGA